jgi:hypothetical protein
MAAEKGPDIKSGRDGYDSEPRLTPRTLNIALAIGSASLCVALASLFYLQWQQRGWLISAAQQQEPAVSLRVQELDNEVTRLREAFNRPQTDSAASDTALVQERKNALQKRFSDLQAHTGADSLLNRPDSTLILERVQSLVTRTNQWLANPNRNGKDLVGLAGISQGLAQPLANLL